MFTGLRTLRLRNVLSSAFLLPRTAKRRRRASSFYCYRSPKFLRSCGQLPSGFADTDDRSISPHRPLDTARVTVPWWIWAGLLVLVLAGISRFMWFLVLFTGYWIVFWQQYISLPGYIHGYISPHANVEKILVTDGLTVICLTLAVNFLTRKIPAFQAVILGTLITSVSWLILVFQPTVWGAILSLFVLALGEIIQQPRYYEYIALLAPPGQQGTYMGFAFLPIGIGSLIGGWFGGTLMHHFGEVTHQPNRIWWTVAAVGTATAALLWLYDRYFRVAAAPPQF